MTVHNPRRRRPPSLFKRLVRAVSKAVGTVNRWCFAPVANTVKNHVNLVEWGKSVLVAVVPALLAGVDWQGLMVAVLTGTVHHASDIFSPGVASVVTGISVAVASRNHRLYDGSEPK